MADKNTRFPIKPSDARPVSSALLAAERAWKRGDVTDTLRWVRRAAEAASEVEDDVRALDLAKTVSELAAQLRESQPAPAPVAVVPPKAKGRGRASRPAEEERPKPVEPAPPPPPEPVHVYPVPAQRGRSERPPPMDQAGEVGRGRLPSVHEDQTAPVDLRSTADDPPQEDEGKRRRRQPSLADEIDAWKTEALSAADLGAALATDALSQTAAHAIPKPTQAVRVLVWREDDGTLNVVPSGVPAPANAIEAMLTALEPGAELAALLAR